MEKVAAMEAEREPVVRGPVRAAGLAKVVGLAKAVAKARVAVAVKGAELVRVAVEAKVMEAETLAARVEPSSKLYPGLIFEYRVRGVIAAVLTGELCAPGIALHHVMAWPGAPADTLLRALALAETEAVTQYCPEWIVLDVEHAHPLSDQLVLVAERFGFEPFNVTDATTWYIKYYRRSEQ